MLLSHTEVTHLVSQKGKANQKGVLRQVIMMMNRFWPGKLMTTGLLTASSIKKKKCHLLKLALQMTEIRRGDLKLALFSSKLLLLCCKFGHRTVTPLSVKSIWGP